MEKKTNKKEGKVELTPLERKLRNSVIRDFNKFGVTNNSIARIFNTTPSTISRIIDSEQVIN